MKVLINVLILILTAYAKFNKSGTISHNLTSVKAMSDVISEIFVRHEERFDFLILGEPLNESSYVMCEILRKRHNVKVYKVKDLKEWTGNAAFIFVNSLPLLLKFLNDYNQTQPKLLFYVPKFRNFDESNFSNSSPHNTNSYFLFESRTKINLKVFQRWSEKSCDIKHFLTLNSFDKRTKIWKNQLETTENFQNFNGCPLKIFSGVYRLPTFEIIIDLGLSSIHKEIGSLMKRRNRKENEILKIFSEFGNFSIIQGKTKFDKDLDVSQFDWIPEPHLSCVAAVTQHSLATMYSPSEPYTNYEKMILPFDDTTWTYLILVLCAAFVGILVINQTPRAFKDLVYGSGVKMPSFNVIGTLFGIGQTKLPDNNFGRIVLMTFIIFCLIFRTAYQGEFSNF
jgi:hypothetical protein